MAGSLSDYCENKILELITAKTAFSVSSPLYVGLTTGAAPSDSSTGSTLGGSCVEAAYTGYARKSVAGSDWGTAASGQITNTNAITFAACTGGSSTVVGWFVADAATNGNILFHGDCASTVISTTQTPATFAAGALVVTAG